MTSKTKPVWAGDDFLSQFVNALIQAKPLYALMRHQARQLMIKTAEKNGIPWRTNYQAWEASGVKQRLGAITNGTVTYPAYYQVPFHAYELGNLCWQAAFEAESATYALGLRIWPKEKMSWQTAQERWRKNFHQLLATWGTPQVQDILDIGCSVGISTLSLHRYYTHAQTTPVRTVGLDLSPYMLAVAQTRDVDQEIMTWIHARAEATGLPEASFDLITLQHVIHELPQAVIRSVCLEAWRLLRPGGCLALLDNDPESPVIQNLPPVLFTLMKSTEPWTDEYYTLDVVGMLEQLGFENSVSQATDPRHRAVLGRKPVGDE